MLRSEGEKNTMLSGTQSSGRLYPLPSGIGGAESPLSPLVNGLAARLADGTGSPPRPRSPLEPTAPPGAVPALGREGLPGIDLRGYRTERGQNSRYSGIKKSRLSIC